MHNIRKAIYKFFLVMFFAAALKAGRAFVMRAGSRRRSSLRWSAAS